VPINVFLTRLLPNLSCNPRLGNSSCTQKFMFFVALGFQFPVRQWLCIDSPTLGWILFVPCSFSTPFGVNLWTHFILNETMTTKFSSARITTSVSKAVWRTWVLILNLRVKRCRHTAFNSNGRPLCFVYVYARWKRSFWIGQPYLTERKLEIMCQFMSLSKGIHKKF